MDQRAGTQAWHALWPESDPQFRMVSKELTSGVVVMPAPPERIFLHEKDF